MDMEIEVYYDRIFRYCYYRVGERSIAEDLTQEAFLKFLNSDSEQPERYLYTIAKNLCIDEYRRKHPSSLEDEDEPADRSVLEDSLVEKETIRNALDALSDEERELVILRYVNDEPLSEICKLTGLSRFAVYRRCNEAKNRLKELLEG